MNRFLIIADAKVSALVAVPVKWLAVVSHQENQDCASPTPETFCNCIRHQRRECFHGNAVSCQCEDAPCANVCPNGAISRDTALVHVMAKRRIGCKTCVVHVLTALRKRWCRPVVRTAARAERSVPKSRSQQVRFRHHREAGPACMAACPTHALICVTAISLEQPSAEKRRRAALDSTASLLSDFAIARRIRHKALPDGGINALSGLRSVRL